MANMIDKMKTRLSNFCALPTSLAIRHVRRAIQRDEGLAIAYQCNIACSIYDSNLDVTMEEATEASAAIMYTLYGVHMDKKQAGYLASRCGGPSPRKFYWSFQTTFDGFESDEYFVRISGRPIEGDKSITTVFEDEGDIDDHYHGLKYLIDETANKMGTVDIAGAGVLTANKIDIIDIAGTGVLRLYQHGKLEEKLTLHDLKLKAICFGDLDFSASQPLTIETTWAFESMEVGREGLEPPRSLDI